MRRHVSCLPGEPRHCHASRPCGANPPPLRPSRPVPTVRSRGACSRCPSGVTAPATTANAGSPDGAGLYLFAFNDRGRGPSVRSRIVQDAAGIPTVITVEGNDYLKNAIAERFSIENGRAAWQNKVEAGRAQPRRPRVLPEPVGHAGGAADARESRVRVAAGTIALLPSGEARAEALEVAHGEERRLRRRQVQLYVALYGLGYQPTRSGSTTRANSSRASTAGS